MLVGVVGFPLLFDTQPRPIAVDIPIEIPDRNKVKPLPVPAQPAAQPPAVSGAGDAAARAREGGRSSAPRPNRSPKPAAEPKPEAKPSRSRSPSPNPRPRPSPRPQADDGAKAKALLEGKPAKAAAAEGRFVVQVGAFADVGKAREARQKVERAGLKTYTQRGRDQGRQAHPGARGPVRHRAEADKAADKIKGLDLPAAILTL